MLARLSQLRDRLTGAMTARAALMVALAVAWANYALTSRWAHVPGSVHGAKEPAFVISLIVLSLVSLRRPVSRAAAAGPVGLAVGGIGAAILASAFFVWFPPGTWALIPFLDDWPPRFQSTVQGLALLRQGALSGWQWAFLGGYHLSSDVTQSLTLMAAVPAALAGNTVGFHLLHLGLFAAVPALVCADCRIARWPFSTAALAGGLAALAAVNYSYFLIRSGDTNSLAGVVACTATLVSAHAAREGRRWGAVGLVLSLTLTNYAHRGFFVYALVLLAVDAIVALDRRSAWRALVASATAWIAGLPLTWESWRYPSYFLFNNVQLASDLPFDWKGFATSVFYNAEILARPGRWFNDYTGLANLCLPVTVFVALAHRDRSTFHAWALLAAMAMVRLNDPQFGYSFARPIHLYVVFLAPVLAAFSVRWLNTPLRTGALALFVGLYIQMAWFTVPHVRSVDEFDHPLVERLRGLDGNLIVLENNFHADVDVDPARRSERSRFGTHFEALLPAATGRFFYAGLWDGWQWSPYRHQVFANGTFHGRRIGLVPTPDLIAELQKWGIRHLLVWSEPMRVSLSGRPELARRWHNDRWTHFELLDADTRGVVVSSGGHATLERVDPLRGLVHLQGVHHGEIVLVRTNYHPSWMAHAGEVPLPLEDHEGQLAFRAPASGTYSVSLDYPRRTWLLLVAGAALLVGIPLALRIPSGRVAFFARRAHL